MNARDRLVRQVAEHHRQELLDRAAALAEDHRFTSGCTWSVRALDRVLLALAGETDPVKLGLTRPEPVADPAGQDDLFSEEGAA